ncbi:type II toxin-antitoxin system HipA family toxin YjjJ [Noviherbaspirillum aridicola]|uniref:Transcriptional regulator n=1 Tax=Noviherbaspirillum aridicola TaxID=2849687 RepID=A0ABQ4Q2S0_9BURK|nr:type II toxin-antitoxin system HipA family toxin YjjJ [Noviherbaspirillum aridicola]GIZ51326.1 transcriptional regulator [Noviherbaspirillum aridicola]
MAGSPLPLLRTWGRMPAAELLDRMRVSRPTMMRAIRQHRDEIIVRGSARRTAYAARRTIRGRRDAFPLYRIDEHGRGAQVGVIDPMYPHGSALALHAEFEWPLRGDMVDGWFDSLPYPLDDMRPQGFLGRHFARAHAHVLQVEPDPANWSEDDILHALSLLGSDMPGNYILGEAAYRLYLDSLLAPEDFLPDDDGKVADDYLEAAARAMTHGNAGSSAAGEFPKFTSRRLLDGERVHTIVKFSGNDESAGTRRWSDLLVCEHLALETISTRLHIAAARSQIIQAGGRTFLEVVRFDRHAAHGRSPVCTWAAMNDAMIGMRGKDWIAGARRLHALKLIDEKVVDQVARIWHFGQLIGNNDMHDGNLAFRPGLVLAPVYDMLPMLYAPIRGVELPDRSLNPPLPVPAELDAWQEAAQAALSFWERAAGDQRISQGFRTRCEDNARIVRRAQVAAGATQA